MAPLTKADLQESPSIYDSPRNVGDVLIDEDAARPLIEASSSGNDTALQKFLSQPQWTKTMLEEPHCIYYQSRPSQGPDDVRQVMARRIPNLERALDVAAEHGQAAIVSTLLAFAKRQGVDTSDLIGRSTVTNAIKGGHAAVLKALSSADPNIANFPLNHGILPLYDAVKRRQTDVVAVLLELGADPLHPVEQQKELGSYNSSLLSLAAMGEGPRMTEMLLKQDIPIPHSGAIHTAAHRGQLDIMRLLMEHGADVNEVLSNWMGWTPLHFAASKGQVNAMKVLEQNGGRCDIEDQDGKTAAQLLEEYQKTMANNS